MTPKSLARIALDIVLWYSLPAAFLFLYVGSFHAPEQAVWPHVRAVGMLLLALALVRVLAARILAPRAALLLASAAAASLLYLLALYYTLVLVGLQSWSRVTSWDLIVSYVPQFGELMETLQVPVAYAGATMLLSLFALAYATWRYLRFNDAAADIAAGLSRRELTLVLVTVIGLLSWEFHHFTSGYGRGRSEPFGLTFYPDDGATLQQTTSVSNLRTAALDKAHEQARRAYQPSQGALKRNVVLIVVDALRPSNMGVLGYGRPTTPFLSKAAASGQLQKQGAMRASCAESRCGLLSISSSIYVHQFASRPFTLQEVLQRHGYEVHMILGGDHTNFYGLRNIYGNVNSYYDGSMAKGYYYNDDRLVIDRVATLPRRQGRPTMFQFHLMSAHRLGKRLAPAPVYAPAAPYRNYRNKLTAAAGTMLPETINYYDNGVLQTDAVIGTLLASLKEKGYLDDALVVVTSDHGEALGEHGLYGHSNNSVHEPLLRIPFLMLSYGHTPSELAQGDINAAQVDIAPTILAELRMERPDNWVGVPLQKRRTVRFTRFMQGGDEGLIDAGQPGRLLKYWRNQQTQAEFAFDLRTDPDELKNLIGSIPQPIKLAWRRELLLGAGQRSISTIQ